MVDRSRLWCGTLNNYTPEELISFDSLFDNFRPKITFCMYGLEVGEENGTLHMQMCFRFANVVRRETLKSVYSRAHWEIIGGSLQQNIDYCSKEGDFHMWGNPPSVSQALGQHRGGDVQKCKWEHALACAKTGDFENIPPDMVIKYYNTFKCIGRDYMVVPPDLDDVCGVWFWGSSGTGKSRTARVEYPGAYPKLPNKWWDGYQGEDNVIIDDFGKSHDKLGYHLKIWADRYGFIGEVKSSSITLRPKKIIVTSNYHPRDIWSDDNILGPILRRYKVTRFRGLMDHVLGIDVDDERLIDF